MLEMAGALDAHGLITKPDMARIKALLLSPRKAWRFIALEPPDPIGLYTRHILPLAAIPPLAKLIGWSLIFGFIDVGTGLVAALFAYGLALIGVFILGYVAARLARSFHGEDRLGHALTLVAYAATPSWIGGIFRLVPTLGILSLLASLYSFYLLYLGAPLLLSILRRYGAHATFFVIGEHARAYPYLLRDMATDGDEIADHTFHHPNMSTVDQATVAEEIDACATVIDHAAGRVPRWFRPPGGDYTDAVVAAAHRAGLGLAMWTDNSGDWALPPAKVLVERVLARAEPGGIVLLHNGTLNTVRALPEIIIELQRRGYRLVTVSELARYAN
jgi:hypothetical protein